MSYGSVSALGSTTIGLNRTSRSVGQSTQLHHHLPAQHRAAWATQISPRLLCVPLRLPALQGKAKAEGSDKSLLELGRRHLGNLIHMTDVVFPAIQRTESMNVIISVDKRTVFLLNELLHGERRQRVRCVHRGDS